VKPFRPTSLRARPLGLANGPWRVFVDGDAEPVLHLPDPIHDDEDLGSWPAYRLTNARAVVSFLAEVAGEKWSTNALLGSLVRALHDLLDLERLAVRGELSEELILARARARDERGAK
jgi:hypothetical protein